MLIPSTCELIPPTITTLFHLNLVFTYIFAYPPLRHARTYQTRHIYSYLNGIYSRGVLTGMEVAKALLITVVVL